MADANSNILSHVSIGTNRFDQATAFYDRVLATLGCTRVLAHPGAVAYGREYPEFWVQTPLNGKPASTGNGSHFGFVAPNKAAVHDFFQAALEAGATAEGAPGPRAEYGEAYYGCFVRDLDGHKIEASYWDIEQVYELYSEPH
ncbi:MAG TPA: VOC family protein [Pseudomonas sp.]|nr:VOC family protein [Pseudomonas sp.]